MKIREMSIEQKRNYYKDKVNEWRKRNPERIKEQRKKYKKSIHGKLTNSKYFKNHYRKMVSTPEGRIFMRNYHNKYRVKKQESAYINDYMKEYMNNRENHRKYLIRQKDYKVRNKLIEERQFCQLCGSRLNLEIHHKKYDESKDIMLLCRICHKVIHRKN